MLLTLPPAPPAVRFIASFAEDRFGAMDVQHAGRVDVVPVRAFVKAMSPGASDAQVRAGSGAVPLSGSASAVLRA